MTKTFEQWQDHVIKMKMVLAIDFDRMLEDWREERSSMCEVNVNAVLADVRAVLLKMTDDERLYFFSEIQSGYCRYCGCNDPECQCWNDE